MEKSRFVQPAFIFSVLSLLLVLPTLIRKSSLLVGAQSTTTSPNSILNITNSSGLNGTTPRPGRCPDFTLNGDVWERLVIIEEHDFGKEAMVVVYLLVIFYLFLGISIASHIFMLSIEIIVSKTRTSTTIKQEDGVQVEEKRQVKIWNDTIANLTLMALGSSAPEILLSVIETIFNEMCPGALGPGTIVGSAAYNLMIITAVCIVTVPTDTVKKIKEYKVFITTSGFAMFAYIWLVVAIQVVSHDQVESWESIFTLLLFPILVVVSWWAEYDFCIKGKKPKRASIASTLHDPSIVPIPKEETHKPIHRLFEEHWDNLIDQETGNLNPEAIQALYHSLNEIAVLTDEEIATILATRLMQTKEHSVLWYRIRAIEALSGKARTQPVLNDKLKEVMDVINDMKRQETGKLGDLRPSSSIQKDTKNKAIVQFTSNSMAIPVVKGVFTVTLKRSVREDITVFCRVTSYDGTAKKHTCYEPISKKFVFDPYVVEHKFHVKILSDAVTNRDANFFMKVELTEENNMQHVILGPMSTMEIVLMDILEPGEIRFTKKGMVVAPSAIVADVELERVSGATGPITVKWKATPKEKCTVLQEPVEGTVRFEDTEVKKNLEVPINPFGSRGSPDDEQFDIQLVEIQGGAGKIGDNPIITVAVSSDQSYKLKIKKLMEMIEEKSEIEDEIPRQTYLQQIKSAYIVNGDKEEARRASRSDVIMHWVSLPWKAVFCFMPTPYFLGGWACFLFSLAVIGFLTTLVGDFANIVGWCLHMDPVTTGITLVAMGTSIPDTFASRIAALQDKTADNAIGNITGSNCVNVFLGLGLPWTIASLYTEMVYNETMRVQSDTLAMIVTIYTIVSIMAQVILWLRRHTVSFGAAELGGPGGTKYLTAFFLVVGWVFYVFMSLLISQNVGGLGDLAKQGAEHLHIS